MARNTAGVKSPVSNEDLARITATVEKRFGVQHFFGVDSEVEVKTVVTVVSKEVVFNDDEMPLLESTFNYDALFKEAVARLKQDYKQI